MALPVASGCARSCGVSRWHRREPNVWPARIASQACEGLGRLGAVDALGDLLLLRATPAKALGRDHGTVVWTLLHATGFIRVIARKGIPRPSKRDNGGTSRVPTGGPTASAHSAAAPNSRLQWSTTALFARAFSPANLTVSPRTDDLTTPGVSSSRAHCAEAPHSRPCCANSCGMSPLLSPSIRIAERPPTLAAVARSNARGVVQVALPSVAG